MDEKIDEAKKWIKERLAFISTECDLNDKDFKIAYDSLTTALICMDNKQDSVNDMENHIPRID